MYLIASCLCGKELKIPVEKGKVRTSRCEVCGSCHDANIYLNSYRTDSCCCHNELVQLNVAEQTDVCNPVLCKGKKCTCKKKVS